jgi:hypothetical protein
MLTPIIYINSHYQTNKIYVIENKATTWIENIKKILLKSQNLYLQGGKKIKAKEYFDIYSHLKLKLYYIL